jgi:sortase A
MTLRVEYRISSTEPDLSPAYASPKNASLATTRTRSSWIGRWTAPILLFLAGCLALGYYAYDILDAHFFQDDQSRQFDQALRDAHSGNASALATNQSPADQLHAEALAELKAHASKASASSAPNLPDVDGSTNGTESSPGTREKQIAPGGDTSLGRIQIAAIGLTAMIQEGTGARTLQRGVGHITGTSAVGYSGNVGLAAHRDTFFRKLRDIHEGDEITLTTLNGSYVYRVDLISIVEPQDSAVLRDSGENILTLVTCYPFGFIGPAPKRFIVRARQVMPSPGSVAAIN